MIRLSISAMLITMTGAPSAGAMAAADRSKDPEAHYRELWSEPIPPKSKRRMVGRYRVPVFSELHREIVRANKTDSDTALEDQIKLRFAQAGMSNIPKGHFRISCRSGLCEYVFVFPKNLTRPEEDKAFSIIRSVSAASCNPDKCQTGLIIGGNNDGAIATLGYYIPINSGLI